MEIVPACELFYCSFVTVTIANFKYSLNIWLNISNLTQDLNWTYVRRSEDVQNDSEDLKVC